MIKKEMIDKLISLNSELDKETLKKKTNEELEKMLSFATHDTSPSGLEATVYYDENERQVENEKGSVMEKLSEIKQSVQKNKPLTVMN
jgi:hypothetical protein